MKRIISYICRGTLLLTGSLLVCQIASGCGRARTSDNTGDDTVSVYTGTPDGDVAAGIDRVIASIAEDSPEKFAAEVSYPVERPYPLRTIRDSAEMTRYYPVMVDDSLKKVVASSSHSDWNGQGWRGWTLKDGQYLWYDGEKVYAIGYLSQREAEMLDSLRRDEIGSLDSSMRGGWIPVTVLQGVGDGTLYRIDRDSLADPESDMVTVRLAVYPAKSDYHKRPRHLMRGRIRTEGTVGARIYEFNDSAGTKAEYNDTPTSPDEQLDIIMVTASGDTIVNPVIHTYWRDHVRGTGK